MNPNADMKLSEAGVKFIHQFEGVLLKAYKDWVDAAGNPRYSIGYGHNGKVDGRTITADLVITIEKAEELFKEDIKVFEDKVKHYISAPLNQNQFDAMVSLAYNVRTSNLEDFIERSQINKGRYDLVPEALMKYVVSSGKTLRGLIRRRTEEGMLFSKPVAPLTPPVVAPKPEPVKRVETPVAEVKKPEPVKKVEPPPVVTKKPEPAKPAAPVKPVAAKSKGNPAVKARQLLLIAAGAKIAADGISGPATRKAEKEFGKKADALSKKSAAKPTK